MTARGAAAAGGGGGKGLSSVGLSSVLHPLAAAYHTVYTQQQQISGGRDFVGMRDYCEWAGLKLAELLNHLTLFFPFILFPFFETHSPSINQSINQPIDSMLGAIASQ